MYGPSVDGRCSSSYGANSPDKAGKMSVSLILLPSQPPIPVLSENCTACFSLHPRFLFLFRLPHAILFLDNLNCNRFLQPSCPTRPCAITGDSDLSPF